MTNQEAIEYLKDPIGKLEQHDEAVGKAVSALKYVEYMKSAHNCNDCGAKYCGIKPMVGEMVRHNCYLWREMDVTMEGEGMKDKAMMMFDHIRSSTDVDPWAIKELQKVLDAYLADGCPGCAFYQMEEWDMPCRMCKRNSKDYYRRAAKCSEH